MSQNNIQSDSFQNPRATWEGCSVLLDINDGDRLVFARLTAGSTLKIGKKNYSLRPLIGCPFGSSFQIENGTEGPYLSRFIPSTEEREGCQIVDECRDSRAIVDNNEAQTLTNEDIDEMRRIVRAPLRDLCSDQTGTKKIDSCNAELNVQISSISMEEMPLPSKHEAVDSQTIVSPQSKKSWRKKASEEALKSWKENGFSSLIIAAPDADAWNLVKVLLPLLLYAAPFAIYHQYLQPLATCMHNLQQSKMAIGMQISEPWLREYQMQMQVLPSRTHPSMQMSSFGGYILNGTKICSS